jgi:hypothetical protein
MATPRWKYCASVYTKRDHCTIYRDDALRVQKQILEKRDWLFIRPKERAFYFIDGDKKVYRSEEAFLRQLSWLVAARRQRRQGQRSVEPSFAWK